jgi:hypothetical protein
MNEYTKRTCNKCGIKRPQPDMHYVVSYVQTGRSKQGVSGATFLGATLFGSKRSYDTIVRWLFNTNQRNYQRKRMIWLCSSCDNTMNLPSAKIPYKTGLVLLIILVIAFANL